MIRFIAGAVTALVVLGVVVLIAVEGGFIPAAAAAPPPSRLERWAANRALDATIAREAPQPPYPYGPPTDALLASGAKLYLAKCSVCHGSGVGAASNVARGLYVPAPQFVKHGVDDDPTGETYWKIEHGIRFTGMPSFAGRLSEAQIWQISYFLKHGSAGLPPAAAAVWNQPHGD